MTPFEKWTAYYTLVRREVLRMFRLWPQTFLPSVITTTLYFVIFGNVVGQRIGTMDGHPYMTFISPGLIMLAMITGSFSGTVSSFFSMKFIRSVEELLVSPMGNNLMLLGFMTAGVVRGLVASALITCVALFFTHIHVYSYVVTFFVSVLASMIFSLGGFINAVFAKKFDDVVIIPTFVLTPLTYLGGVFYSINLLAPGWRAVSMFNPIVYIIKAFRYGLLGVGGAYIWTYFFAMATVAITLYTVCLVLLVRGVGLRD